MKIYRVLHTTNAPSIYPVPDPDRFAAEVLRKIPDLDASASIGAFQMADPTQSRSGFFNLSNKVLVFSEDVYLSEMGRALGYSGDVHRPTFADTGDNLCFLNVTATYNCLDFPNTTFYGKRRSEVVGVDHGNGVKTPAFLPKLIGDSWIFRVPQMKSAIFIASDGSGIEEDFCTLYQSSGLSDLDLREVWSVE